MGIKLEDLEKIAEKHKRCGLVCENRFSKNSNGNCLDNFMEEVKNGR